MNEVNPALADVGCQVSTVVEILQNCLKTGNIAPYYAALRASNLLQLPLTHSNNLPLAHRLCADVLRVLGSHSVGAAYGLENHFFVLGGVATYQALNPTKDVQNFLARIQEERLLLANTQAAVHSDRAFSGGATVTPEAGGYQINGAGTFVSLATYADLLWLQIDLEADPAVFVIDLRQNPSVVFGDFTLPQLMLESETHTVSFQNTRLGAEARLRIPTEDLQPGGRMVSCHSIWHWSLIAAQFLGAASGALEELRTFARTMKGMGGRPLTTLDNVRAAVGRLGMHYAAAAALVRRVSTLLQTPTDAADWLTRVLYEAKAANWFGTAAAEDIVTQCRRLIGTRIFRGGHRLERLSLETMVGPLVPRGHPIQELEYGRYMLDDQPMVDPALWETAFVDLEPVGY